MIILRKGQRIAAIAPFSHRQRLRFRHDRSATYTMGRIPSFVVRQSARAGLAADLNKKSGNAFGRQVAMGHEGAGSLTA